MITSEQILQMSRVCASSLVAAARRRRLACNQNQTCKVGSKNPEKAASTAHCQKPTISEGQARQMQIESVRIAEEDAVSAAIDSRRPLAHYSALLRPSTQLSSYGAEQFSTRDS
uniref:Uncharacterized protein n=1 Tax=Steinernema glaseri TaxID=37863 RepID=A0A1I7YBN0_9BILA